MRFYLVLSILIISQVSSAQKLSATNILNKSIAFHDPLNKWSQFEGKLFLTETRDTGYRYTQFTIANSKGEFLFERDSTSHGMILNSCFIVSGEADCERIRTIRNYYLYLWGLPMKLKDAGTPLQDTVQKLDNWHNRQVYALQVIYERESWTFFFDQQTFELRGYQFYFNYKEGGELILLEDMVEYADIKFPKSRTWYELPSEEYLAKDVLDEIK